MWSGGALIAAALLVGLHLQVADARGQWQVKCMAPCTCDLSHFADLPVATQWLRKEAPHHNQVTYEENEQELGDLLKMAMCVFQRGTNPQRVLGLLPKDIQVLTILQGRDSGKIALEADYLQDFHDLMVLDIQGFQHDEENWEDRLVLRNDALRPLVSLQYLNLQNIKLLGHTGPDNRLHPLESPRVTRKKEAAKRRVVFLKPTDNDVPLVSYREYKQEMERAGLTTFAGLSDLLSLRVYACDLPEVNWEMFQGLGKLQHLSLERNNLLFVPEFAFYGTPQLKSLSLAGNQLLSLEDTALAGLLELDKLDLSSNNFSHLSELSLPPFPALRTADFRNNPVGAVFPSTFEIMNGTFVLYLGGKNSPLNLLPNSFLGLSSLKQLDVSNVGISLLERELLRGMPKLQKLVMTGSIHSITYDAFLEVPKLEHLLLSHCNITSVSMDAFYGLYGLISLDLSHNLLIWLPPGLFDQQFSLKELLLQNNRLTELPSSIFTRVPAKMVRLEHNPWHCSCAMWEWQPSVINKVKQKSLCQFAQDKGSGCRAGMAERYMYDKRVSPRCSTPVKYNNWNVFHLLRKELHCNNKHKKEKKAYLKKKFQDYEKSIDPEHATNKYLEVERMLGNEYTVNDTLVPTAIETESPSNLSISAMPTAEAVTVQHANDTEKKPNNNKEELSPITVQSGSETNSKTSGTMVVNKAEKIDNSTKVPLTASDIEVELTEDQKADIPVESKLNKKSKQQLDMQREKEEKYALKEKIKSGSAAVDQSEKSDKELKKAFKLDMEKKRNEKLKRVQL